MKTLVLNTLDKEVSEQIKAQINDKEVEIVDTSNMKIAHCMGCNQCWLKTPGICVIKDDYEEIIKKLVKTENLWIVSDTRFGFLDYKGKRVMDRIVPMLNMTVGFRDGWMRHEMRYHPLNIGLLYTGDVDQTMMEDWCKRTAANIGGHSLGAIALGNNAKQVVNEKETKPVITGRPKHLVIINGSPRVAKFSNTDKIIHSFVKGLEETGITWELYNLSNRKEWDAAREVFLTNERILIAFPLYVECMPSLMLEFLESLPSERRQPAQLSFLLHGGMDEGYEFRFCERILQELPAQLGCSFGGTLIHGGSFGIRTREDSIKAKIVTPYEKMGRLFAQNGSFLTPEARKFTGPEQYPWLVRKMVSLLFLKKVNKGFEDFAKSWGCTRPLNDKPYSEGPRFTFNTVGLFTNDNKATVDFYTKAFGFTTTWDGVQPNVEMFLGNNRIILFPRSAFEQMVSKEFEYPQGLNGTMELSFDVPTFADVDKEYQNALNNGATSVLPPTTEPWGQRTCYVADPDGNLIEIGSFVK